MGGHFLLLSIGFESGRISLVFEGVFEKKFKQGERAFPAVLRAFLRGVLRKVVFFWW
jgi:hypothetical protein